MKKLLILMLVLGLTSAANAVQMISLNGRTDINEITIVAPSGQVTIDVYDDLVANPTDDFIVYLDIGLMSEGLYTLSNPRLGDGAGDFPATFGQGTYGDYDDFEVNQAWAVGSDPVAGTIFLVDLHCEGEGDVLVELYDAGSTLIDSAVIHQIPEPMTIALLGLGGLFLRRRRK